MYVVVLAKSQKKSDLRIADLASSEEDRKKVCGLPEAVLRMGYPRFESKVQLVDGQEFSWMAHISKPSKRESGYRRTFHVRTVLGGSIVVSKKGKAQQRRCERMRKPIPYWISPIKRPISETAILILVTITSIPAATRPAEPRVLVTTHFIPLEH